MSDSSILPDVVAKALDLLSDYIMQYEGQHDDESDARAAFKVIDRYTRQRDAAVRARALEEAVMTAMDFSSGVPPGYGRGYVLDLADEIRALIPTPPAPAPAPDTAPVTDGMLDGLGYLRWTKTSCRRCGYEKKDCTCPTGFVAPAPDEAKGITTTVTPSSEAAIRAELIAALRAMMEGSTYGSFEVDGQDIGPVWRSIRMPSEDALNKTRAALERAGDLP